MTDLFSKYVMKKKKEDVAHSSAFAQAQNRSGFGAASTQSFSERMKIDKNRKNIRGYKDAKVVNDQGREAWRIRQEAKQRGENTGIMGVGKGGTDDNNIDGAAATNSRGGVNVSRPPVVKKPGISR